MKGIKIQDEENQYYSSINIYSFSRRRKLLVLVFLHDLFSKNKFNINVLFIGGKSKGISNSRL